MCACVCGGVCVGVCVGIGVCVCVCVCVCKAIYLNAIACTRHVSTVSQAEAEFSD